MKKREIWLAVGLIFFGLAYYAIRDADFRWFGDLSLSSGNIRLSTDRYVEFNQAEEVLQNVDGLTVNNLAGEITVDSAEDGKLRVLTSIRVYHENKKEAETIHQRIRIDKETVGRELRITVSSVNRFPYNRVRVLFRIKAPPDIKLRLLNRFGDVAVQNVGSELVLEEHFGNTIVVNVPTVDIRSRYGEVWLRKVAKQAKVENKFGNIHVEDVATLELHEKYGSAEVKGVADKAYVQQEYGRLIVDDVQTAEVEARHCKMNIKNVSAGLKVSNSFEAIIIEHVSGEVNLATRYCKIDMSDVYSDSLGIENSFANINVEKFSGGSVDIFCRHGQVQLSVNEVKERININCQHGDIKLQFPASMRPTFNLKTQYGEITNETSAALGILKEGTEQSVHQVDLKPEIILNGLYGDIYLKNK